MSRLTALERRALHLASHKAGAEVVKARRSDDNRKAVTTAIANRLTLKGYARVVEGRLRVTHDGQRALNLPIPEPPPIYLAKGGAVKYKMLRNGRQVVEDQGAADPIGDRGYTTLRHRAADELETMDVESLHPDWAERAEAHRTLARADSDAARLSGLAHPEERLAELRRMAAERGIDASDELRFVNRGLKALERKVRGKAA